MSPLNTEPLNFKKIKTQALQHSKRYGLFILLIFMGVGLGFVVKSPLASKDVGTLIVNNIYPITACITIQDRNNSAAWAVELFQNIGYTLPLKENAIPPVFFTKLPDRSTAMQEAEWRELLIKVMLPPLLAASQEVLKNREEIHRLRMNMEDKSLSREEEIWVKGIAKTYGIDITGETFWDYKSIMEELVKRVDIIPYPITLAMIIMATEEGRNRDRTSTNQLFGNAKERKKYPFATARSFPTMLSAIENMYWKTNTFSSYEFLRDRRYILKTNNEALSQWAMLIGTQASQPEDYANKVMSIIHKYKLSAYSSTTLQYKKNQNYVCVHT